MAIPNDKAILRSLVDGSLTEITDENVPGVTVISQSYIFAHYPGLTKVELNDLTTLGEYTFYYCPDLQTVNLPEATTIGSSAFRGCRSMKSLYLPKVTTLGAYAMTYVAPEYVREMVLVLPKLTTLSGRSVFDRSYFLAVDIGPGLSALTADAFYHNTGIQTVGTLILRNPTSVVTAASTGAINGLRSVYVPSALISGYQTATNWSTYYGNGTITFSAIEGSEYEFYYADGTPIPTT